MKERNRAREQYSLYMANAVMADAKAVRAIGKDQHYWVRIAKMWRGMANDIRDVWGGPNWTAG